MSTNIHITAVRQIQVVKTGEITTQSFNFAVRQTPSNITVAIMNGQNRVRDYFDWVLSTSCDQSENIYADDDLFGENEPIGTRMINMGVLHVNALQQQIQHAEFEGYDVIFSAG